MLDHLWDVELWVGLTTAPEKLYHRDFVVRPKTIRQFHYSLFYNTTHALYLFPNKNALYFFSAYQSILGLLNDIKVLVNILHETWFLLFAVTFFFWTTIFLWYLVWLLSLCFTHYTHFYLQILHKIKSVWFVIIFNVLVFSILLKIKMYLETCLEVEMENIF